MYALQNLWCCPDPSLGSATEVADVSNLVPAMMCLHNTLIYIRHAISYRLNTAQGLFLCGHDAVDHLVWQQEQSEKHRLMKFSRSAMSAAVL